MVYLFFKLLTLQYTYVIEKSFPDVQIIEEDYKNYLETHVDFIVKSYLNDDLDFKRYSSKSYRNSLIQKIVINHIV